MKKTKLKKITLHRETIHLLNSSDLKKINGAVTTDPTDEWILCPGGSGDCEIIK
jgi:hypothetical protein